MNRAQWSKCFGFCMVCGYSTFQPGGLHTHEITGGCNRKRALNEPACWLRVCPECHPKLVSSMEGLIYQLALKKTYDPEHYNLAAFLRVWRPNGDGTAITEAEVDAAMKTLGRNET